LDHQRYGKAARQKRPAGPGDRRWASSLSKALSTSSGVRVIMSSRSRLFSRLAVLCSTPLLLFAGAAQAKDVSVAAISGYFAQGFGVSIVQGLKKAEKDLGVKVKLIDTGNRSLDYEEQFNNVAKDGSYDLVFVMGWELVDALQKTAAAYPNTRFVFIDGTLDSKTITYANFAENEGSFLAGALGGMMADKGSAIDGLGSGKAIGFVGGRDLPVIRNFLVGYEQGAKAAAPGVRVDSVFAGTFDDPAKGSELTMTLYGQGSDIVFNVAGPTGEGVLQASAAASKYSIGVDIDQCGVAPGHVMASMLKHADVAVYSLIKDVVDGKGVKPGTYTYDLKSGGVELLLCPQVSDKIPADVKSKLEAYKADVASGKIKVNTTK
jgi:basic membrane protein A